MSSKNCNRLESVESPLGVWTNPVYKTSWASLPAKQAITVDSSSSVLNTNLLHDWSNFDLSKLYMPVEHISLMPLSRFCLSLIHPRIYASISYSLQLSQSGIWGCQHPQKWTKEGSHSRRPLLSLPNPPPFFPSSLSPYPFQWRQLLRRLVNEYNNFHSNTNMKPEAKKQQFSKLSQKRNSS